MLDCHIIVSAATPRDWVTQCLGSVYEAADHAGFKVDVWPVEGVVGHIGKARANGYAQGTQPYVTCVDDDDYLLPHAFAQMLTAMKAHADAIFTPEYVEQNEHRREGAARHHLVAYKRHLIIPHTDWPSCGDIAQMRAVSDMDTVDLTEPAYVHRVYMKSGARQLRMRNTDEIERANGVVE